MQSFLVGRDYRIHRLHLCRVIQPPTNESTPLWSLVPGPCVAPDRVLSRGQIELNCLLMPD